MTHGDLKTKYLIGYDKANITSSYPSLTDYEIATVFDKAYNALIAQKLTGNNPRRVSFEGDTKAIEDLRPLITTKKANAYKSYYLKDEYYWENTSLGDIAPDSTEDPLSAEFANKHNIVRLGTKATGSPYSAKGYGPYTLEELTDENGDAVEVGIYYQFINNEDVSKDRTVWVLVQKEGIADTSNGVENLVEFSLPTNMMYYIQSVVSLNKSGFAPTSTVVTLVSHEVAKNFFATNYNKPWIKNTIGYIENEKITLLYDSFEYDKKPSDLFITFIKEPTKFVKADNTVDFTSEFELNETMAEELVNLAIIMSLETVESTRLTSKVQTRPLES